MTEEKAFCYYHIKYNCHPETCAHWEHFTYRLVELEKVENFNNKWRVKEIIKETDSKRECLDFLEKNPILSKGYYNPYE